MGKHLNQISTKAYERSDLGCDINFCEVTSEDPSLDLDQEHSDDSSLSEIREQILDKLKNMRAL